MRERRKSLRISHIERIVHHKLHPASGEPGHERREPQHKAAHAKVTQTSDASHSSHHKK